MMDYENDDRINDVAYSCRQFRSKGLGSGSPGVASEGISCSVCKNWNGQKCVTSAYDSVIRSLD